MNADISPLLLPATVLSMFSAGAVAVIAIIALLLFIVWGEVWYPRKKRDD